MTRCVRSGLNELNTCLKSNVLMPKFLCKIISTLVFNMPGMSAALSRNLTLLLLEIIFRIFFNRFCPNHIVWKSSMIIGVLTISANNRFIEIVAFDRKQLPWHFWSQCWAWKILALLRTLEVFLFLKLIKFRASKVGESCKLVHDRPFFRQRGH